MCWGLGASAPAPGPLAWTLSPLLPTPGASTCLPLHLPVLSPHCCMAVGCVSGAGLCSSSPLLPCGVLLQVKEGPGWSMCPPVSWAKPRKRSALTRLAAPQCVWRVIEWGPLVHLQVPSASFGHGGRNSLGSPVCHQDAVLWKGD